MRLSEAIHEFHAYALHEKGHSPTTQKCYMTRLRHFSRWLEENGHGDPAVYEVSAATVRRYYYHLSGEKLRPRTLRGALHALRSFFDWGMEAGLVKVNPARDIKLPKPDAAIRKLVQDSELERLLATTENQASEFKCVRDKALFSIFIFCGLRRQELMHLEIGHVNLEDRSLLVQRGKGDKARAVPLCQEMVDALRDWVVMRQGQKARHPYLFTIEGGRRLGDRGLTGLVEETKARAGMKGDAAIQPHSMRHACGTRLMRNGADLKSIQHWLGHSDLRTAALYLHESEQQIRKVAPLAGLKPVQGDVKEEPPKMTRADLVRRHRTGR